MDTIVIIQARVTSERYPRKVLKRIAGKKMLQHVIDRCKQSGNKTILAIPDTKPNDVLAGFGGVEYYRGSEKDVLSRFHEAALLFKARFIARVTGDCPLIDPELIEKTLVLVRSADYVTCEGYPRGVWCEAFSFEALSSAALCATKPYQREHVTPYMKQWAAGVVKSIDPRHYRVCVDEYDDMRTVRNIVDAIGPNCRTPEINNLLDNHPELICNNHVQQREVYVS